MTTYQLLSLCALAIALAGVYGSSLIGKVKWRSAKPDTVLSSIEAVATVRDRYQDEAVRAACNALLAALLKVQA